jgi:hypothetical protein
MRLKTAFARIGIVAGLLVSALISGQASASEFCTG